MKEIAGKRLKKLPPTYLALLDCFCQLSKEAKCQKQSKFWSVLHFHEGEFEKHGSLILFKTFWLFWVSFVKEITKVFFFTQTKVIVPWKQIRCLFSFFTALCQPQWPWRGLSVAPGTRSRCECPDKVRQSFIATQSSILWSHVSGEPAYQIWCWSKTLW